MRELIVVDANPLISTLLGGKAHDVLFSPLFAFLSTEKTIWEVKKFISVLSAESGVDEREIFFAVEQFPLTTLHFREYQDQVALADRFIGHRDKKDVDILALTLAVNAPLWTHDNDFLEIPEIQVVSTATLLKRIAQMTP